MIYIEYIALNNICVLDDCVPYSRSACLNASKLQGLQLGGNGKEFIDNHATKGCHAETGFAYYGIYEDDQNEHRKSLTPPLYRPNGYDCSIIFHYE